MEFIKPDINLDFIGKRRIAFVFSIALVAVTIVSLVMHGGPKYGIDFAGGTVILVKVPGSDPGGIKDALGTLGLGDATVQRFGPVEDEEYRIHLSVGEQEEDTSQQVREALVSRFGDTVIVESTEMVGPQVGKDLRQKAMLAMFFALLFITVYISGRFELKWLPSAVMAAVVGGAAWVLNEFGVPLSIIMAVVVVIAIAGFFVLRLKFAMGAIVALIHDVTITVGVFSLFGKEFNLPIIAALLTIIGYSLNDTIIVFDRIRENNRKHNRLPLDAVINRSINETLSRTVLTSLTTLVVVISLYALGGGIIHDFAFALLVGVMIGTYSSVFVASPILLAWRERV
ncbi:MAG: protein translocase subunit SecF [Desulfatibacillaceae bacterium]